MITSDRLNQSIKIIALTARFVKCKIKDKKGGCYNVIFIRCRQKSAKRIYERMEKEKRRACAREQPSILGTKSGRKEGACRRCRDERQALMPHIKVSQEQARSQVLHRDLFAPDVERGQFPMSCAAENIEFVCRSFSKHLKPRARQV